MEHWATGRPAKRRKRTRLPVTSHEARRSIINHLTAMEAQVMGVIEKYGTLSVDDIECLTGMTHQSASARVCELHKRGRLRDSGQKRVTKSGRRAIAWEKAS